MTYSRASALFRFSLVFGAMIVGGAAGIGALEPPRPDQPVLVIAPPWSGGPGAVLDRAGGREIAPNRAPLAALGVLDDPQAARRAGAWAVWDASLLARLCGVVSSEHPDHG